MARITLEDLHRDEATIEYAKARLVDKEHKYRVNIESQLKAHETEGTAPSAELTKKSEDALKSIEDMKDYVRYFTATLKDDRARFYYAEHMTDRTKLEETKHEEDEKDGLFLAGTKRALPDDEIEPDPRLVALATRNGYGYVVITSYNKVLTLSADIEKVNKGENMTVNSLSTQGKSALGKIILLLVSQEGESITHCPQQMDLLPREAPQDTSHVMGLLTTCLHRIQEDDPLLGGSVLAMLEDNMGRGTYADLEASLKSTFSSVDLRAIHGTQAGNPVDQVLSTLGGEDSDARKTILMQLLRSALVLNKYACLATALATAIAPKLGRGKDDQRRHAITLRALQRCLNYHRKLHRSFVDHTSGYPQLAHALTDTFGYNKGGAVGATLANDIIKGCLEKLGKHPDINCDLVKFLGSVGYGLV